MLRLETLGGLTLLDGEGERPQPRRRIALLVRVAASGAHGVSRDELLALFWPERDIESARHSLDQLLYQTRRALGASPVRGTASLRLDPDVIACDVDEWTSALGRGDLAAAMGLYRGPFLHGFYLNNSAEFERWVETARGQYSAEYRVALETLATRASHDGSLGEAVTWWRRLAAEDRFGSRTALGLMRALVDAGDRAGALEFARVHERIMRTEFESAPDPAVSAFVNALRMERAHSSLPAVATSAPVDAAISPSHSRSPAPPVAASIVALRRMKTAVLAMLSIGLLVAGYAVARNRGPAAAGATHTASSRPSVATWSRTTSPHSPRVRLETANIAAHDLVERGADPRLLRSDSGLRTSIAILEQAVALDTNYAAAYALLASRYATAAWGAQATPISERRATFARAEAAARRAVALDDSLADAHTALGYVLGVGYEELASLTELERASALDPNASETQEMLSKGYEWVGRPADAIAAAQRAVSAHPLSVTANAELGDAFYFAHRYDEALAQLVKVATLRPPLRRANDYIATVYCATGRWPDAIALLRRAAPRQPYLWGLLGYALARSGQRAEATRIVTRLQSDESDGLAPASAIAEVYAGLGDRERAFVWLERSIDDHSLKPEIMGPLFEELRADARFEHLRQRLGIDQPAAAAAR